MAQKISSKDLFEKEDVFKGVRDSAEKTIKKLGTFKKELRGVATETKKAFGSLKIDNAKSIKTLIELVEKANKVNKEAIAIDKARETAISQKTQAELELIAIEKKKQQLTQEQLKTARLKSAQDKRNNAEKKKTIKLAEQETNAYKKLVVNTRNLKNESKRLGAEMISLEQSGKKNTKAYIQLERQYKKVTKSAQAGDVQLKKLDKTVGDNFRSVGNYKSALAGLQKGLGALGLAFGVGAVVRTGVESIVEFNQAIADLSAITGASGKDLEFYKQKANELGIGVEGGASAVVEAYKLIGSAKPELLENAEALNQLTESAIVLSQASGMDLPEAAKNLTDAMNQFGASSEQAGKFIDVLAAGSKFGSAEIPQITEALLQFGAIAKSTNVTIQESTGAIELLAEKGVKGAEAGTKLRNVMLKLSAPDALPKKAQEVMEKLGISFEDISDQSKPFEERLEALKPLLKDNAGMVQVFGVQNVVAGNILLNNTERLGELTEQMDTNGVAQDQANKRTNTLGHSLMELKNSFIGLFTSIGTGEGSFQSIIDSLKWIGKNLPMIIGVIGKLIRAFLVYKTTMVLLRTAQRLYVTDFKKLGQEMLKQIPLTKAYAKAQKDGGKATKGAGTAVKGFGKAFASIGIFLVITLVTELAMAWYDVASGAKAAREEEEMQAKQAELIQQRKDQGTALALRRSQELNDAKDLEFEKIDRQIRQQKLLIDQTLKASEIEKQKQKIELKGIDQKKLFLFEQKSEIGAEVNKLEDELKDIQDRTKIASTRQVEIMEDEFFINKKTGNASKTGRKIGTGKFELGIDKTEMAFLSGETARVEELLKTLREDYKVTNDGFTDMNLSFQEFGQQVNKTKKSTKTTTKTTKEYNTELKDTTIYLSKQKQLLFDIQKIQEQRKIEEVGRNIDTEFEAQIKNIELTGEFQVETLNELIDKKADLEKEHIENIRDFEIKGIDDKIAYQEKKQFDALKKQRDKLILGAGTNQKAIDKINDNYDTKYSELVLEQTKRYSDGELEKVKIKDQATNDILEIDREKAEKIKENNEALDEEVTAFDEGEAEDELEKIAEIEQAKRELYKVTADYFVKQSEKKIAQIDKELAKATKQQSYLEDLAKNGNINAEQSLAENQRIITEFNKQKEDELKKQARIRLAQSVYSTYSSKVEAGKDNPLVETIKDVTLLQAFISSLPAFHDGTENTGSNGRGIDGKGGFNAILHPNERVIPKALNDKLGSISNEDLTRLAIEHQNEGIIRGKTINNGLDMSILVAEVKDLKQVIQDKPEFSAEVGKITQTSFEILEKTRKGNTTTYNRFNVK